uniref:RING-type E3 ubiquitin transferase n=1 Tax=Callorhinchus milii TaxID=7868 RepID=A0A4W3GMG5_CALMI
MASGLQAETWTEEIICPVCLDFFTDPVSLGCGHNFCRSCVTRSWEKQEINCCAVCQETFPEKQLTTESKLHCEKHREELKLFCESDKKLLCVVCSHGQEHRGHSFLPIEEAADIFKDKLKSSLASLTQRKETALEVEAKQKEKISQLKVSQCLWSMCLHGVMSQCLWLLCVHGVLSQCLWLLCVQNVMSQCLWLVCVHGVMSQ